MNKFYTSVRLNKEACNGCINCIKRCPTEAIRVRNGKAVITSKFCIDCGECIRICPYHAKYSTFYNKELRSHYKYTVALPDPALYPQFNNLNDVNILLTGLKKLGFNDVFEISGACEYISYFTKNYVEKNKDKWPIISIACPATTRLIQVKFPSLIDHLLPFKNPYELAAELALEQAIKKTGLPRKDIGIIAIAPCPAKVSGIQLPLGIEKSNLDAVFSIKDIYPDLLSAMNEVKNSPEDLSISGKRGIRYATIGGESYSLGTENYLAADGIENVMKILEDLEDHKFSDLSFVELNACSAGCLGGALNVENPYIARVKLKKLRKNMPETRMKIELMDPLTKSRAEWILKPEYNPVFQLGANLEDSMEKMQAIEDLTKKFPGLDCGSCGAPSCKALAEDVVRGVASENYCFDVLRKLYKEVKNDHKAID